MSMNDLTQHKRKLKHPVIRIWVHPNKGGDDYYYTFRYSKKNLLHALFEKEKENKEGVFEEPIIAYDGKEYTALEFLYKKVEFKLKNGSR